MNREIKFRAWVDNTYISEMHYANDIQMNSPDAFSLWHKVGFENFYPKKNKIEDWQKDIVWMQFTGLHDKNGNEIYEGDIVKTQFKDNDPDIAVVEYDTINPCFVMSYKYKGNGHQCHEYDFIQCDMRTNEIIGNIHQNPELLNP